MDHSGSLPGHFWHIKVTLDPLWGHSASLLACEGDFGVTLELLFAYDGDFMATLGSLGDHCWHLRAASGAFWGRFGSTCGIWR